MKNDYDFVLIKIKKATKKKLKKFCIKYSEKLYAVVDRALEEYYKIKEESK